MSDNPNSKSRKPSKPERSTQVNLSGFEHIPPHNLDAERGVIGSLLIDPLLSDDIVPLVSADDFYSDAHCRIFRQLIDMRNNNSGIDLLLLIDRLRFANELESVGGEAYLADLISSVHVTVYAKYYAQIVRDKAVLRRLIHTGIGIVQDAFAPEALTKELLNTASQKMFDLCESQTTNDISTMAAVMAETMRHIDARMAGDSNSVPTGFDKLDQMLDGMHPNELIILAARPSMGKTALALNIAEHVAVDRKLPVLLVSLEMSRLELGLRLIYSRGKIDSNNIRKNFLTDADSQRFLTVVNQLSEAKMFIDDTSSRTLSEIAAVARRLKRQNDLRLVIIDYLTLLEPENPRDPRQEQVAKMARRLKGLARELKIPVLCLAQLNRQAEGTKDNRPRLSHLRESGAIEQDADVVLFVHREDRYVDKETAEQNGILGHAELIVAKQRNGPTGDVKLSWFGEYTRFESRPDSEEGRPNTEEVREHSDSASHSDKVAKPKPKPTPQAPVDDPLDTTTPDGF